MMEWLTMGAKGAQGLCLLLALFAAKGEALRAMRIVVAEAVLAGDSVRLCCDYDLEQAALYSIKWYRGDEEFYRYVPKEAPPARVFPVPGINVDVSSSNARSVSLLGVQRALSGLFRCEVSADAPLFHTDIRSQHMLVAEVPEGKPTLTLDRLKISAGEKLRANCSAGTSFPAANITWFINGQQLFDDPASRITYWAQSLAADPFSDQSVELRDPSTDLQTSWSSLELLTAGDVSRAGRMRVRCLVTVLSLYRQSEEREVVIGPPVGPSEPSRSTQQHRDPPGQGHALREDVSAARNIGRSEFLLLLCTLIINSVLKQSVIFFR